MTNVLNHIILGPAITQLFSTCSLGLNIFTLQGFGFVQFCFAQFYQHKEYKQYVTLFKAGSIFHLFVLKANKESHRMTIKTKSPVSLGLPLYPFPFHQNILKYK